MDMLEETTRKGNGDASEEICTGYLNKVNVRNEKKPRKSLSEETHSILDHDSRRCTLVSPAAMQVSDMWGGKAGMIKSS